MVAVALIRDLCADNAKRWSLALIRCGSPAAEASIARCRIGQETLVLNFTGARRQSTLDKLLELIDWTSIEHQLRDIFCAAKGESAWPPSALFKAMLIAVWHDLSDVRLAEAIKDRAPFQRLTASRRMRRHPSGPPWCGYGLNLLPTASTWHCSRW